METVIKGGMFMDETNAAIENSILLSIKQKIGIVKEYTIFDSDIIDYINSTFLTLSQLGVGPTEGFLIKGDLDVWTDFIPDSNLLHYIKTYIYLSVKLIFDPPTSSIAVDSINRMIHTHEWRIMTEIEKQIKEETTHERQ